MPIDTFTDADTDEYLTYTLSTNPDWGTVGDLTISGRILTGTPRNTEDGGSNHAVVITATDEHSGTVAGTSFNIYVCHTPVLIAVPAVFATGVT